MRLQRQLLQPNNPVLSNNYNSKTTHKQAKQLQMPIALSVARVLQMMIGANLQRKKMMMMERVLRKPKNPSKIILNPYTNLVLPLDSEQRDGL